MEHQRRSGYDRVLTGKRPVTPNISPAMFKAAPEEVRQGGLDL